MEWSRVLEEAGTETAKLIVELQRQDLASIATPANDLEGGDAKDDGEIARALFGDELRNVRAIGAAIAGEVLPDHNATAPPAALEDFATTRIAPVFSFRPPRVRLPPETARDTQGPAKACGKRKRSESFQPISSKRPRGDLLEVTGSSDEGSEEIANALADSAMSNPNQEQATSSVLGKRKRDTDDGSGAGPRKIGADAKKPKCSSCLETEKDIECYYTTTCEHIYCDECLQKLFQHSMHDEFLFPPRCCKTPIEAGNVVDLLGEELRQEFLEKYEELQDLSKIYCYVPTCSTYIGKKERADGRAKCPKCDAYTCLVCKEAAHVFECPDDEGAQGVHAVAREKGWGICEPCGRVWEHDYGCWHMTCACGHEFCYLCGKKWKDCKCPWWDEARLYSRARRVVDREGRGDVAQMAGHLQQHYDCQNHQTIKTGGIFYCDGNCAASIVGHPLPSNWKYIHRCQGCRQQWCDRCLAKVRQRQR
ncbi:Putative IBR domain, Zinc finger, RING/FYVE/PHD-type, E3 ubiquitin ligase RBR family [Septoria linicola]|uniref:RBR-type E3 ubiquitin transferase n=1 Tax=Septoria linicola TaxID=215465 RepID=A0A9Q9AF40_9PEZI|nr:putative IBR domain, Zinc finger, RING/FYVE/PHD-type, E3 ubiquitin ligase RBR family [Septoria linicola]USW48289.1 Putative IBR domain, Zinc finger, RING/FYVE/PHD-type, E3 ubiquitin ligase RBR family [Septoria linicola]